MTRCGSSFRKTTPCGYGSRSALRLSGTTAEFEQQSVFPRRVFTRVAHLVAPSLNRGRRESRAPTAPAAPCAKSRERMHTDLTGTAETSRLSPRNGFTAYTRSPREAAFLAPVVGVKFAANVAPGSRRQDQTTSPYAAGSFAVETAASIASRAQRVVTMAIRPSLEGTG